MATPCIEIIESESFKSTPSIMNKLEVNAFGTRQDGFDDFTPTDAINFALITVSHRMTTLKLVHAAYAHYWTGTVKVSDFLSGNR